MEIWRYSTGNLWCWDFGDKLVAEGKWWRMRLFKSSME